MLKNIKIWQKMLLICTVFTLPILTLLFFLIREGNLSIGLAQRELAGVEYLRPLFRSLVDLEGYKGVVHRFLKGDVSLREKAAQRRALLERDLAQAGILDQEWGGVLGTEDQMDDLQSQWRSARKFLDAEDGTASGQRLEDLSEEVHKLYLLAGNNSHLILDPDLDSYYTIDNLIDHIPENIFQLGRLRDLRVDQTLAPGGRLAPDIRNLLASLSGLVLSNLEVMRENAEQAFENNPLGNLEKELSDPLDNDEQAVRNLLKGLEDSLLTGRSTPPSRGTFLDLGDKALEAHSNFWEASAGGLKEVLDHRIQRLRAKRTLMLSIVLLVTLLTYWMAYFILKDIRNPIRQVTDRMKGFAQGKADFEERIHLVNRDEIGELAESFNVLIGKLREDSQQQMKSNEGRLFEELLETAPDPMMIVGPGAVIEYVNRQAEKLFGYGREELLGREVKILVPERFRDRHVANLTHYFEGPWYKPSGRGLELFARRKDGSEFPVEVSSAAVNTHRGTLVTSTLRDMTEQNKALETQRLLAYILEQTIDAVAMADLEGKFILWNKGAEQLFGYKAEEILGRPGSLLDPPDEPGAVDRKRGMLEKGDVSPQYEAVRKRKDGALVHVAISSGPLKDPSGLIIGYSAIYRDITERKKAEETQRRLTSILEQTTDAVSLIDLEGRFVDLNHGAEELYDHKKEELLGKLTPFMDPRDYKVFMERVKKETGKEKGVYRYEAQRTKRDGRVIDVESAAMAIRNEWGETIGYSFIVRDITERKKAEETRARLASILERTPDGVVVADLDSNILLWNKGAEGIFGYSAEEMVGKNVMVLVPPDQKEDFIQRSNDFLTSKVGNMSFQTTRIKKDGWPVQVAVLLGVLIDPQGKTIGFSAIYRDITEQLKALEIQAQLADMLQQTPDPVSGTSLEGVILTWNRSAERVFGYKAEEIIGKQVGILVPEDRREESRGLREIVERGEVVANLETVRLKKGGEAVNVSLTVFPVRDSAGKITGISAILRDITDKKQAEDSLRRHEEQMRLMEKMNAIGRLAGGVAHDFNNLLSVIGGNAEFLASGLDKESSQREEVEDIRQAVHRGAELTKQLLIFGRKQVSQPQSVDLNQLTSELQKMLKRLLDADIELTIKTGKDLRPILADPGQVQQVMMNLAINARDAMPKGGILVIETRDAGPQDIDPADRAHLGPGPHVCFTVTDTGEGMSPEVQKRIFEPFFTTKGIGKGTGLGLTTVYGIVQQWKGQVKVRSSLGQGTSFTVLFPAMEAEKTIQEAASVRSGTVPRGSETILLVEDEEPVRKLLVRMLKGLGYQVLEAPNGVEAIKGFWQHQEMIQLLITDTVMPKMNGKELADELRKVRPEMKVLFISGYPEEILSQQGVLDPGIFLIQKPFEMEELSGKIRSILDNK